MRLAPPPLDSKDSRGRLAIERLHLAAALLAMLCISTFFLTTALVELFGSSAAVARVKSLIVTPGLWLLIPALAMVGGSGLILSMARQGRLLRRKKKRMPIIAANGLLVLVPCAVLLDRWAAEGSFDTTFHLVQGVEFVAGAINILLMALNARDGVRMTRTRGPLRRGPARRTGANRPFARRRAPGHSAQCDGASNGRAQETSAWAAPPPPTPNT